MLLHKKESGNTSAEACPTRLTYLPQSEAKERFNHSYSHKIKRVMAKRTLPKRSQGKYK